MSRRLAVGHYIIEHKGKGHAHRATDRCALCEEHAKNAVPRFSSDGVDGVFVRHGGDNGD